LGGDIKIDRPTAIEIKPLQPHQIEAAKQVIGTVCKELWPKWEEQGSLQDVDDVQSHYLDNNGLFLVLVDDGRVVGTGTIRRLSDKVCELKRMWFLKEYRGRGLGLKLSQMLLDFAREAGYKKVRLDTGRNQEQALRLYQRLGFTFIERYNDGPCNLFMEKTL